MASQNGLGKRAARADPGKREMGKLVFDLTAFRRGSLPSPNSVKTPTVIERGGIREKEMGCKKCKVGMEGMAQIVDQAQAETTDREGLIGRFSNIKE